MCKTSAVVAEDIVLRGRLQGIGVRPAIFRLATELGLVGMVRNTPQGISIHVEGTPQQTALFRSLLPTSLPDQAEVSGQQYCESSPVGNHQFEIVKEDSREAIVTDVPLDAAVCHECLEEVRQPGNRRYQYAFNSCARCGPRYTVIRQMPFERADTAMVDFPRCNECDAEYHSPADRRFHAQTISCSQCGPRLWSMTADSQRCDDQQEALNEAAQAVLCGMIVAVKGVGGYQLIVDATNPDAVERLRQRKGRISKPFAVMMRTAIEVKQAAFIDDAEERALLSAANPIVLLQVKDDTVIAKGVYPDLNTVGIMLPTSPLHDLLLERVGRPLICTSGNREGTPIAFEEEQAEASLKGVCDLWLHHNRPIVRPIDDSVVRVMDGSCVTLRLARGMAPLRFDLETTQTQIALGGQLKSSVAWSQGGSACLSPHISDLGTLSGQERYLWHIADWQSLYRFSATRAAHDCHPDYFTSHAAYRLFPETQPLQHHYAHVLAMMIEHQLLDQKVLGVVWDGTGYGTDRTIWGGEFFVVDRTECTRTAHLRSFGLPGGEAAIFQPWRTALSLLNQLGWSESFEALSVFESLRMDMRLVNQILESNQFSPATSSGGRLFDGVAALILGRQHSEYEGQFPMMLEAIADPEEKGVYEFAVSDSAPCELDWRPMIRQVFEDVVSNVSPGRISMKFHRGVAEAIMAVCRCHSELPVVLAGGVFQNRLLSELIAEMSRDELLPVYLPGMIPPGDGGLAAGQLIGALSKLRESDVSGSTR
ncbi:MULTISPECIES: carbamoyltransferase HypF [Pirellulaceae]|nr:MULTISPECIES: carbamoyltransferase HypF [Pirellulaceae]